MAYKLSDNVLRRIVQVMQEGLLTGTDITDHMRMIRLEENVDDTTQLVLTDEYKGIMENQHETMLQEIENLKPQEN